MTSGLGRGSPAR